MKRYSIASSAARRRETVDEGTTNEPAILELERLEQEITLVLQEIDKNLLKSNAVINDKIFPILKSYGNASSKVWNNVNFWKFFMEQAANVELNGYEEPANPQTTESNTLKNTRSSNNILIGDEDEDKFTDANDELKAQFRKPIGRTFHNMEETPTWSVEQKEGVAQASTPQGSTKPRAKFEINDELKLTDIPQMKPTTLSPRFTHTIRQSLDNYHKLSISPKKYTPQRHRSERRSSIVQSIIDSSPTLPEPPVLLSEMKEINLSHGAAKTSSPELNNNQIQRFPATPRVSGGRESLENLQTIRERYTHDDSDIPPPNIETASILRHLGVDDAPPPMPELLSESGSKKRKLDDVIYKNEDDNDDDDDDEVPGQHQVRKLNVEEEDNVFVEKHNSATSTLYHSLSKIASDNSTLSESISATYLKFQEVLDNSRANDDEDDTGNSVGEMGSILKERYKKMTR